MNRRVVAVILVLIVFGTGSVLILFPRSSDNFHFEVDIPEGDYTCVSLHLTDLQDCILNISFTDDPDLLYRIDVMLFESYPELSAFDLTVNDLGENSHLLQVRFEGKVNIRNLKLVLGSGVPYEIGVLGTNVTATIIYGNNSIGSDASLVYSASGPQVNLIFTEDMEFSVTGMEVSVGSTQQPDYVYLVTDLPAGVNGLAGFQEPLNLQSSTGWSYRSRFIDYITYGTDPLDPEPLLELGIIAKYGIYAWLVD